MRVCPVCTLFFNTTSWHCPSCGYTPPLIEGFPALAPDLTLSGGGFRAEYFQGLAELEAGNFWFQARNKLIIWALRRFFPDLCRFLEIGCGTGFVLSGVAAAFPTAELTGSEIFSAGLPHAASRVPRAELLQMDARVIPYVEHFDVVGAFDVLEHIVEDEQVLRQIYKTLRPAGGIVLTVPQHPWLWSRQDQLACHVRRYTDAELRFKVAEAGFTVIYDSSFVSLLLPFLWISRRLGQTAEDADPLAELRTSRLTNRFLSSAMTAERLLIRLGVRFSAGGSLLLVARRG